MSNDFTVCFDLDGVIADAKDNVYDQAVPQYGLCNPVESTIEVMHALKRAGVRLVICTARWEEDRPLTERWLKNYSVPYDVLVMGKPKADVYIDDRSYPMPYQPEAHASFNRIMAKLAQSSGHKK